MLDTWRKPKMTWARLRLLCEAVRRITRASSTNSGGAFHGLGYPTDYRPVINAGWMRPTRKEEPKELRWYTLTDSGWVLVNRLLDSGLNYRHIEAGTLTAPPRPVSQAELIGDVCFDVRSLFSDPEKFMATHVFDGHKLPELRMDDLRRSAPRGTHG
jgi:hypothetical protein